MKSQQPTKTEYPLNIAFAALFIGALAMGISPVFVRNAESGPFASAFWRVALALPILLIWAKLEANKLNQPLRSLLVFDRTVILTGLLFAGDLIFWHLAILNTNVANATLLACLAPVWVVLLAKPFLGETFGTTTIIGLAVCLIGAFFLIGGNYQINPQQLNGDFFGLITSVFFGLYFLAVRIARRQHSAGILIFLSTIITAVILLLITLMAGQSLLPETWKGAGALAALGIVSHAGGQGLLAVALGSLTVVFSSLVIFIEAIAAAIFGWIFLDETIGLIQIGGGSLVLAGIWIARPTK